MKVEPFNKEYFFNQCDPTIKDSLSDEQSREVKRLLKLSMQCTRTKATKVNFDIWFFGIYFVTLYFGKEHRSPLRRFKESSKVEVFVSIMSMIFSSLFTLSIIVAIFLTLYYVKTFAGIDFFEESHLSDIFKME
ncbi:hypothetical protein [Sulfurimonas sp.]|uniref:hypothetical protein n=1 Tax=Sulfurimonas sp. TaxID=2022749 RepID=UPI0025FD808E|nr:hypothetical protein [Sulfurimonas sp.]